MTRLAVKPACAWVHGGCATAWPPDTSVNAAGPRVGEKWGRLEGLLLCFPCLDLL